MKQKFRQVSCRAIYLLLFMATAASAEELSGSWQCNGNDGRHSLSFQGNTLLFDNEPLSYLVMGNVLLVEEDYGVGTYGFELKGEELLIQYPDGSLLSCRRGKASPGRGAGPASPTPPPSSGGVDSATLQAQIAGIWWGYSGSTERKIGLCPGGRYMDYSESSYSGRGYDSGGYETHSWGAAGGGANQGRWSIQGDYQQGTIYVQTDNGRSFSLPYSQVGEPGCLNIGGSRLCRSSASCN